MMIPVPKMGWTMVQKILYVTAKLPFRSYMKELYDSGRQ